MDEKFYLQIKGVAMGSACAPSIANLFMEQLELNFIDNVEVNPFHDQIIFWKHYIDDIFVLFKGAVQFDNFTEWLNNVHCSIKFVGSSDTTQINFLDTVVYRDLNNKMAFRVYRKPTDKNALLHYSSHHSRRLINNLPFGQFLHLKHNSTSMTDYLHEEHNPIT